MKINKKRLLRGGLVFLILLGIGEVLARYVLGLGTPPLSVADPEIEYMFRPNQDVYRFGNHQLYNAYSMRNEDFPERKQPEEYRIICFGDSVLNGGNLTDHERLATVLLEKRLERELGRPVTVGNVSAGSWGPENMLAYAERFGLFDADLVIIQVSSHDIGDLPEFKPLNPYTHPVRQPCCALWEGIVRYVPRYIPFLEPVLQRVPEEPDCPDRYDDNSDSLGAMDSLYAMSVQSGARFILVLHGDRDEVETGAFGKGHHRFKAWAAERNIHVVDLSPAEAESLKSGVSPYRKNDEIHLSDAGQQIMADELFRYLSDSM